MTSTPPPPGNRGPSSWPLNGSNWTGPRVANAVLGTWLFVSAFVWPHAPGSRTNTWILGIIIAVVGVLGMQSRTARPINTFAAVWLFFSTAWIYHETTATIWNNCIVAVAVFALSLSPSAARPTGKA